MMKTAARDQVRLSEHQHFPVLDGLRGVAALTVVLFHSYMGGGLVPNGSLAVDLFFLMSGFVISNSYGTRLAGQMTKVNFVARRFVRLYPMLFIGALGGIVLALLHNKLSPSTAYPMHALLTSGGLSLLVLPYLEPTISEKAFSFNPPIWSLFFEIVANIAYVLIVRRLNIAILAVIIVTGLAGVVWYGPLGGGGNGSFIPGFPRVVCGFFGGVLLYQMWVKYPSLRFSFRFLPLTIALVALFCIPKDIGGVLFVPSFLFMAAVVWGAIGKGSVERRPVLHFLGEISYPVYLIHWLTLYLFYLHRHQASPCRGQVRYRCCRPPLRDPIHRLFPSALLRDPCEGMARRSPGCWEKRKWSFAAGFAPVREKRVGLSRTPH